MFKFKGKQYNDNISCLHALIFWTAFMDLKNILFEYHICTCFHTQFRHSRTHFFSSLFSHLNKQHTAFMMHHDKIPVKSNLKAASDICHQEAKDRCHLPIRYLAQNNQFFLTETKHCKFLTEFN